MNPVIVYAQMSLINAYADVSSRDTGLTFGLSLHLCPFFVYVSSEGSGKSAHIP